MSEAAKYCQRSRSTVPSTMGFLQEGVLFAWCIFVPFGGRVPRGTLRILHRLQSP